MKRINFPGIKLRVDIAGQPLSHYLHNWRLAANNYNLMRLPPMANFHSTTWVSWGVKSFFYEHDQRQQSICKLFFFNWSLKVIVTRSRLHLPFNQLLFHATRRDFLLMFSSSSSWIHEVSFTFLHYSFRHHRHFLHMCEYSWWFICLCLRRTTKWKGENGCFRDESNYRGSSSCDTVSNPEMKILSSHVEFIEEGEQWEITFSQRSRFKSSHLLLIFFSLFRSLWWKFPFLSYICFRVNTWSGLWRQLLLIFSLISLLFLIKVTELWLRVAFGSGKFRFFLFHFVIYFDRFVITSSTRLKL